MARGGYRPNSGPKKGTKYRPRASKCEQKPKNEKAPPGESKESAKDAPGEDKKKKDPLAYMLDVMNDPHVDDGRRDRMAIAAAPFIHPRAGDGPGKKEDAKERAKRAASGIFAPGKPPKLEVVRK